MRAQSVKLVFTAWAILAILVFLLQAAGHWEAAVHVLCDATMSRLVPNIILRSAAISACEKAGFCWLNFDPLLWKKKTCVFFVVGMGQRSQKRLIFEVW